MDRKKKIKLRNNNSIDNQIDGFIDAIEEYNHKRLYPRRRQDYTYLRFIFKAFVKDQNKRALDISTASYRKILQVAYRQFPMKTMWNLCIDGRVLAILAHGAPARVGSSIRVPGGMLREFIRGEDGRLKLEEGSQFAKLLTAAFERFDTSSIAEVFDSHLGCTARLSEEQLKGRSPSDSGLLADVSHKKQIAAATVAYVAEKFGKTKTVLTIQTSFDPHSGFMYMGLETEAAFSYGVGEGEGFTTDVLKKLVHMGKIISTEALVEEPRIKSIFDRYVFPLDWKDNYVKSAARFWDAIADLKEKLAPILEQRLKLVYRQLSLRSKAAEEELDERALLLLTNAFSGYLHHLTVEKEPHHTHFYPYGLHREEGVKVSEGGYPPYGISMFVVFSLEENDLPSSIELATSLVRSNRLEGRVADRAHVFANDQQFAEASVPVIVQEIVRDSLKDTQWQNIGKISWDDLPKHWEDMTDEKFFNYLAGKGDMHYGLMRGINNLRKRMAMLYEPGTATSAFLVEHYKVALPMIVDRFRRNWFVVPFVKLGFA